MQRFKNILCMVETGEASKPVMKRALTLAGQNRASLTVVDVVERVTAGIGMPEGGPISADLQAALVSTHAEGLQTLVDPYRGAVTIQTRVLVGVPFLEVVREVLRNGHDLVIKSPEHRDWLDRLLGSDDMHLLRKCPCPVWLIKPERQTSYRRILAAVDIDDEPKGTLSRQILEMASSLALSDTAELHVVHTWEPVAESALRGVLDTPDENIDACVEQERRDRMAILDALIHKVVGNMGQDDKKRLNLQKHLVKGRAHKEIPVVAKQIAADLVVMGTVARIGIPGFIMGNTAETILNQIDCSVLAIKPAGFKTPVKL